MGVRKLLIFLSTVVYLFWIFWGNWTGAVWFIAFCIIEFFAAFGYLYLRKKYGHKVSWYRAALVLTILPLVLCKFSGPFSVSLFGFLGISYITFRAAQIIIEIYDGVIKELKPVELFAFLLFFPTFESGPIDRSRRFSEDWNKRYTKKEYLDSVGTGIEKILLGLVYKFVLAALLYPALGALEKEYGLLYLVLYAYCYGIYLFFDFAGFSSIAIGIGYLLGIRVPENFNKPFISIDMKDFWNRWHMSLSYWFRDFLFSRFVMTCIKKKWFSSRITVAATAYLVNMSIMGIWHGVKADYILYGVYHGLLLAGTEIFQKKSKLYKKYHKKRGYKICSWFITMNLVMFGFLIFSGHFLEVIEPYYAKNWRI